MCVIIDANIAALVFADSPDDDFAPVLDWLCSPRKHGCIAYGGQLARELFKRTETRRFLRALQQAGRARQMRTADLDCEEKAVLKIGLCRSDDPHVVALARVSGARTLCSRDHALHQDFRNPRLISKPRGSVYMRPEHQRLLKHTSSCGLRKRGR